MERRRAEQIAVGAGIGMLAAALLVRPLRRLVAAVPKRVSPDLDDLTKDELYRRAQKADIAGRSEMTKDELVRALKRR
ncbi:MAG TPA: hypothetical protein VH297_13075 [Gaiellaceae bacterium]